MFSVKFNRGKTPVSVLTLGILICASLILAGCRRSESPAETVTPVVIVVTATPQTASNTAEVQVPAATSTDPAGQPAATPGGPNPSDGKGLLFGPFHLPDTNYGPPFTGAFISLKPENAQTVLDKARAAGMHLVVNMAGGRRAFQASGGAFSVDIFKQQLDAYKGIDFGSYVADGTLIGHLMFDEPQDPSNWNGVAVPFADIDAAAQYSKELWPDLPVGVGGPPSFLAGGAPYKYLDFTFAQYSTIKGDAATWLSNEASFAKQAHLALLLSINILGGNNRSPVTAEQLKEWTTAFINEPSACGLLMWKYNPAYIQSPDIMAVLNSIDEVARSKPARKCMP